MKKILLSLKQPYPYKHHSEKLLKTTGFILIFVFLFLLLFSPFNVNVKEHKYNYTTICLLHAFNAAAIYLLFFLVYNKLTNPSKNEERWNGLKAIKVIALVLLLIGFGSFLLRPILYTNTNNFSWYYFFQETVNTFLAGTLGFALFTLFDYRRLVKKNSDSLADLENQLKKNVIPDGKEIPDYVNKSVSVKLENEVLELIPDEFIFAKSDGNYVTFYFKKDFKVVKMLKRISLKNLEEQIGEDSSLFIRTHRAFLVNIKHISKMSGNAQGYLLFFEMIDFPVPVSRALLPKFKKLMEGT